MPLPLHEYLGVKASALKKEGVFNKFVDIDSMLHVDPALLSTSRHEEMRDAHAALRHRFNQLIHLIDSIQQPKDISWRAAAKQLTFSEPKGSALGYSQGHTRGLGVGPDLAEQLLRTSIEIVNRGIRDPELFELLPLFQNNVGPDRLSDMSIVVGMQQFLRFTERVSATLQIGTERYRYGGTEYHVPMWKEHDEPLLLFPEDVLRDLPVALDWDDVDIVCAYNDELRTSANQLVGRTWKEAIRIHKKDELLGILLDLPEALRDLVEQYKSKSRDAYDFAKDPKGEIVWYAKAIAFAGQHPLNLSLGASPNPAEAIAVVRAIIGHFKKLIEHNGLWEVIHDRPERTSQLTFYAIADAYCKANDLDLSPEANGGRGPVDFKLSRGANVKILVEVKRSTNTRLFHGFERQLPIYEAAEDSQHSFFLVVQETKRRTKALHKVLKLELERRSRSLRTPEVRIVDASPKPSASKS